MSSSAAIQFTKSNNNYFLSLRAARTPKVSQVAGERENCLLSVGGAAPGFVNRKSINAF
jgi:hypothetical protein